MYQDILVYNYQEHFKAAKYLSHVLPPSHPKRIELAKAIDEMILLINDIKSNTPCHPTK